MKIHSNTITEADIHACTRAQGMSGVYVETLSRHGSRSRARSFNISLSGNSPFRPNSGAYGADGGEVHAAMWDEWGIFIEALFKIDPEASVGQYKTHEAFRTMTCNRFDTLTASEAHRKHTWKNVGAHQSECKCGAKTDFAKFYAERSIR